MLLIAHRLSDSDNVCQYCVPIWTLYPRAFTPTVHNMSSPFGQASTLQVPKARNIHLGQPGPRVHE